MLPHFPSLKEVNLLLLLHMECESVDVLVIGGGAAGLAAAQSLVQAGFQVSILEGRDRIGGRIHTLHTESFPVPVELGAEFLHGKPAEVWDIVRHKMFPVAEVQGDNVCSKGRLGLCNDFWDQWERVSAQMRLESGRDESFLSFVERVASGEEKKHAIEYVEGFNAAKASEISLRSLIQDRDASNKIDGMRAFHVIHGYDQVIRTLGAGLTTHLWTVVKEIHWNAGKVVVHALDGASGCMLGFEANAALITLPLGVLQSVGERASIRFTPDIPSKAEAGHLLRMGNVVKAILCFKEPFWMDRGFEKMSFLHAEGEPFPVFWTTAPLITPVLTAWAGGPPADELAGLSQQHILNSALKSLAVCFGTSVEKLRTHLVRSFIADWHSDPFSLGAYSYAPAGHVDARKALAAPVDDTLFFAGEATHTEGYSGTVHGAIATGRRAATQIQSARKPSRRVA